MSTAPVTTMLPVIDMQRARDFYESKLGMKAVGLKPDGKFVYACADSNAFIALFPEEGGTKADHTAISFQVDEIGAKITALKQAGVVFEDYDFPGLKTVDHVCVPAPKKPSGSRIPRATICVSMTILCN